MTQTPALHSTPLTPGVPVQSTPPAPTHPPHNLTFSFVLIYSNVALSPGIGHLVCLGSLQGASQRTWRDRPEAAIVFAVTAGRNPSRVSHRCLYGQGRWDMYGGYCLTTGCRTRRRCGCSQSRQRQIGSLAQSPDWMGMRRMMSHPCCLSKTPSSRSSNPSLCKSIQ